MDVSVTPKPHATAVIPLERAWSNGRRVTNTEAALLLCLLFVVLLRKCAEFCRVFLLDSASFSVELLDVIQPGDAAGDLQSRVSNPKRKARSWRRICLFSPGSVWECV